VLASLGFVFWIVIPLLVIFCPPLVILISASPMFRGKKYKVYTFLESRKHQIEQALVSEEISSSTVTGDQTTMSPKRNSTLKSHFPSYLEKGWFRAFLICCFLSIIGWIPGVLFAIAMIIWHFDRFVYKEWLEPIAESEQKTNDAGF